ncbi:MAG: nuclear transport factor 2 family protein [Oscillospiraceae bacterium]|nr:nuclear transport factor 2 family protein [Oscillospiraceae bacterium]
MIEKYIAAMTAGDSKALAALFSDKCRYFDYCPVGVNRTNYHVYGRACIDMFFHNKFTFRTLVVTDPVIENENTANFLVAYGGTYLCARATIESYDENGLIRELTVCPA